MLLIGGLFLFSACRPEYKSEVDKLNDISYSFHYRNLDSTKYYANKALSLSKDYDNGYAEALNNLAFVSIVKMNYDNAYKLLNAVLKTTDNQIELLVADIQFMRLCQRQSRNKDFYIYRESALHRLHRIKEEQSGLTLRQLKRLTYAKSEFDIVNSTYFYYIGLRKQAIEALDNIDPYGAIQQDTAQLLSYYYNIGSGGMITSGTSREIIQKEFDYLVKCYLLALQHNYPFWEANSMQAISEHLQDKKQRDMLIADNLPTMKFLNVDHMPDSLLAGNLAQRSLDIFIRYGDVYQIAGAYRTLAQCYWHINDYHSANICLNDALLRDTVIQRAPDLVASIREQMSLVYSAIDDKTQSDFNRNIYLDMQEKTRQDRQLEARADQLNKSASTLNFMIGAVVFMIVIVILLLIFFDRMRVRSDKKFSIERLFAPLDEWQEREKKIRLQQEDNFEQVDEQIQMENLHLSDNLRRNIEQRAKIALVNSITPLIDRIIHEINCLRNRHETEKVRLERYAYISELTNQIGEYNNVLTQWIQLRQGQLSIKVESFALQDLFDIVVKGYMSFRLKGISLKVKPTDAVVKADKTLTLFMINTLADNARKYTPQGGCVTIYSQNAEEAVEIVIEDNGQGMTEKQVLHLFDHKTIVDESLKENELIPEEKSHGFGLMNCKGIIDKYRKISSIFSVCSIKVESEISKGSRFAFRLPKGVLRLLFVFSFLSLSSSIFASSYLLKKAAAFADSAYFCNLNGRYETTLDYADSCRTYLNKYYRLLGLQETADTLRYIETEVTPVEITWYHRHLRFDYNVILDIRNETAVANLALHDWDAYHYNNRVYTLLFRETSADNSLGEYVRVMQRSENNKNVAIILLVLLLILIFPAYYFLYYRHRLYYRLAVDRVDKINAVLLSDLTPQEKLSNINKIWAQANLLLKATNSKLNDVVEKIRLALANKIEDDNKQSISLELAKDELHRIIYENQRLHISNNVLDNCLSTLKHETMYYPSRIRQLVDEKDKNLNAINEVALYYKQLYALLSEQAMVQIDNNLKANSQLVNYLLELLKKISAEKNLEKTLVEKDNQYVIIRLILPSLHLSEVQCAALFTPLSININYMVCRQIVREIGETTNLRGCGIEASHLPDDAGTQIEITLPRQLNIKLNS